MSVVVFFVLALIVVGIIAYPLLPGRTPALPAPAVSDGEIERAVRDLRRARNRAGLTCPACGKTYQRGDRFCVHCGGNLPQVGAARAGLACPSCGANLRESDRFCAKCGFELEVREVS